MGKETQKEIIKSIIQYPTSKINTPEKGCSSFSGVFILLVI